MPKTLHRPESDVLRQLLLAARRDAGLTQTEVADAWGVPQERISAIERGIRRLDLVELQDLCSLLGVDLMSFVREYEAATQALTPKRRKLAITSKTTKHRS